MGIIKKSALNFSKTISNFRGGGQFLIENYARRNNVFPYYHIISNDVSPHTDYIIPRITVEKFKKDIEFLLKYFKPIDLESIKYKKNGIILTFDDGYREMIDIVAPICNFYGIKAIFFVNKDFINNKKMLHRHLVSLICSKLKANEKHKNEELLAFSELNQDLIKYCENYNVDSNQYLKDNKPFLNDEDLIKLSNMGHYIGGHSVSHPNYAKLTIDQQITETIESIEYVKNVCNLNYKIFAFPYTDKSVGKEFFKQIFNQNNQPDLIFGNSGLKKDIDSRIVQRFSLEKEENADISLSTEIIYKWLTKFQKVRND